MVVALLYVLAVSHFCRFRFIAVLASLFLCKVRKPSNHAKYQSQTPDCGKSFVTAFHRLCQSGYSTKLYPQFLGVGRLVSLNSKRKELNRNEVDDDQKLKTHRQT